MSDLVFLDPGAEALQWRVTFDELARHEHKTKEHPGSVAAKIAGAKTESLRKVLASELATGNKELQEWAIGHENVRVRVLLATLSREIWNDSPEASISLMQRLIVDPSPNVRYEVLDRVMLLTGNGQGLAGVQEEPIETTDEQRVALTSVMSSFVLQSLWPDGKYHPIDE